jgi:ketosteroid isomerase-like protein
MHPGHPMASGAVCRAVEAIMANDPLALARACYQAYEQKDRSKLEALLADDFHFTSPIDNALDRATYFAVCWPNSRSLEKLDWICSATDGERVFVVYEGQTNDGKRFRNSEVHTVRGEKIVSTEVYFGWDLPHDVAKGQHVG